MKKFRILFYAVLVLIGVLAASGGWTIYRLAQEIGPTLPAFEQVRQATQGSETRVLSREGEVLQRLRSNPHVRQGQWLALNDMSPALQTALLASEDKRFYRHGGVDWLAVTAAGWHNVWHRQERKRGASTLTMQLTGLLDDNKGSPGRRSVAQKLLQAVAAILLENRWNKTQILEAYLNLVPFRGELVGVAALSNTLFGKSAHSLNTQEAAIAAVLIRAPNAAPRVVAQRACRVAQSMAPDAAADCTSLTFLTRSVLQRRHWPASDGLAPHLARKLLHAAPLPKPSALTSTLSAPLQRFAVNSLQQHLRELRGRNVMDGAVLVLDNATGEVLAWVGSSGDLSEATEVDAVMALRQPGSTLKPFLYAQALAERRLTAASLIEDSSAHIATPGGLYVPQNYDRRFKGWVSVRTALASSLNVPAVRALVMVSPDAFFRQLQDLGLNLAQTGGWYGYSLALGSPEVSLLNLTNAYRTLANGGRHTPVRWISSASEETEITEKPDAVQAIDARAAFIIGDILSDNVARASTFGLDSVLATRFWTAVKTGTSKDMRDNWAVGWSQHYTVGVWVGNADGSPMHDVSGTDGAAPVWADVMRWLHQDTPSHAPDSLNVLAGVLQSPVHFGPAATGQPLEAARGEWFLTGTEQQYFAMPAATQDDGKSLRIIQPANGSIFALDPDMPSAHQRIALRARALGRSSTADANLYWRLNGSSSPKIIGQGRQIDWLPGPGRHRIELTDTQGRVRDSVQIEVRGVAAHAMRQE